MNGWMVFEHTQARPTFTALYLEKEWTLESIEGTKTYVFRKRTQSCKVEYKTAIYDVFQFMDAEMIVK